MTLSEFSDEWDFRFRDNDTFNISEADLREFKNDIAQLFGVAAENVPAYLLGLFYASGYLVRFTPDGGPESFYYSLKAGKLPPPAAAGDANWKLVPGPVVATVLSQSLTLLEAQALLTPPTPNPIMTGRLYKIAFGPDASGHAQTVYVEGLSASAFAAFGILEVTGVQSQVQVDVVGGTYTPAGAIYTDTQARAAQLNRVAPAGTTTVTLTAESPRDYGTASSGTFTVDATNAEQDAGASFRLGAGAGAPAFVNAPPSKPFVFVGVAYAANTNLGYSIQVLADAIQVVIYARS